MNIQPNDKVVCIDGMMSDEDAASFSEHIVTGGIYAIREVSPQVFADGHQCIHLVGIYGAGHGGGDETGFCSSRFRRLGGASAANAEKNQQEDAQ